MTEDNVLLIDSDYDEAAGFIKGLKEATKQSWTVELHKNNVSYGLKRYITFFAVVANFMMNRKNMQGKLSYAGSNSMVFANLTLCQELLPNANIQVIGVSWTLGVIFVFYLLFPFFCYLLSRKKRAWLTFTAALIFHVLCIIYFFDANHMLGNFSARTSFIYCAVYFVTGGLVYLYRDKLSEIAGKYRFVLFFVCIMLAVLYFVAGASIVTILPLSTALLIYAIGRSNRKGILCNPVTKFISGISFEVYLCHMAVYCVLEKYGFIHLFENDFISYCLSAAGTIGGAILFSLCAKWALGKAAKMIKQFKGEKLWLKKIKWYCDCYLSL